MPPAAPRPVVERADIGRRRAPAARPASPAPNAADDDDLVRQVAGGDRRAWTSLVERHLAAVHGTAWYMLGDRAEAEDVAQETFVRLMAKADGWQPGQAALRTWLHRVAVNLCIDRRRARRAVSLETLGEVGDMAGGAPSSDARIDRRRLVHAALVALPDRQRAAVVLVYYQGFSNGEAAALLGASVEAVESLLARGRRSLKQQLGARASDLLGEP